MERLYARVPSHGCAHIVTRRAARCSVGRDEQAHTAAAVVEGAGAEAVGAIEGTFFARLGACCSVLSASSSSARCFTPPAAVSPAAMAVRKNLSADHILHVLAALARQVSVDSGFAAVDRLITSPSRSSYVAPGVVGTPLTMHTCGSDGTYTMQCFSSEGCRRG